MSRLKKNSAAPEDRYYELMARIRERFETIERIKSDHPSFSDAETIGGHLRKIVEGVAFGCLIATEHSVKEVPRSAVGKWNAEQIFVDLKRSGDFPYPDPNRLRKPTPEELRKHPEISTVIVGVPENRLPVNDLRSVYRRTHPWTHEENPYVSRPVSEKNVKTLFDDVDRVYRLLRLHRIGIQGISFLCTLKDEVDGKVKVATTERVAFV